MATHPEDDHIPSATGSATNRSQKTSTYLLSHGSGRSPEEASVGPKEGARDLARSCLDEPKAPPWEAPTSGDGVERRLRAFLVAIALGVASGPLQARPLQVAGTAGYLSEWELEGAVTERMSLGGSEFFGRVTWKHVGLCSVNGPPTKVGELTFRISGSGGASRINATISFEGARCVYSGEFSGSSTGHMDCSDARGVPLSISIR
jgi:hypothetical protein